MAMTTQYNYLGKPIGSVGTTDPRDVGSATTPGGYKGIGVKNTEVGAFNQANLANLKLAPTRQKALLDFLGFDEKGNRVGDGRMPLLNGGGALYDQLLSERRGTQAELMGMVNNFGDSYRSQLNRDWDAKTGSQMANLESRGLGSSSLSSNLASSLEEGRQQALLGLEDQLLGRRMETLGNTSEGIFGAMENELGRKQQDKQLGVSLVGLLR